MGVDHRHSFSRRSCGIMPGRSWRSVVILALTLLVIWPLYQIRNDNAARYYQQYIYEQLSHYLDEPGVYNNTLYQQGAADTVHSKWNFSSPCSRFPNMDGVMLVMKTGATEAFDKIPTQLLTSLQCIDDFLLFSDKEQQIGKYHVYDVLDRVDETIKAEHSEFKLYEAQKVCPVSQKDCTANMKGGWELDKYKFINMVVRTWEMRPDMEWYVFAEADTYVVWSTLIHFLRANYNPKDSVYIGSVAMLRGFPFAHGGSGYVVSGALMKKMVQNIPQLAAQYDAKTHKQCCGDVIFSMAVAEVGGKVRNLHPMFNGEKPNTLPYGPGQWCEPVFTMHHLNSEEVSTVWQYEQTRVKQEEFMQIKELYHAFFAPHLMAFRKDWDNLADDVAYAAPDMDSQNKLKGNAKKRQKKEAEKNVVEKYAHQSPSACAKVCEAEGLDISADAFEALETETERSQLIQSVYDKVAGESHTFRKKRTCFGWRYQDNVCYTSKSFKFGRPKREVNAKDQWTSGWFVKGINDWIETQGDCAVEWRKEH